MSSIAARVAITTAGMTKGMAGMMSGTNVRIF